MEIKDFSYCFETFRKVSLDHTFLVTLLFSVRHKNHLGSEKLIIVIETYMK